MNNLAMELVRLCKRNRDGSFATQANRQRGLVAMANDLYMLGFKMPKAQSIKPKHVEKLVSHWQNKKLSTGTIKNRLGWLRWWTHKVNKANVMPRTNQELGIGQRKIDTTSRAKALPAQKLRSERMQIALELMAQFGLRFEEALKLRPAIANLGDRLALKGSWAKGGRARKIPIRTKAQQELLKKALRLAGQGSLIPAKKSYKTWRKTMESALQRAGMTNVHGLRHQYAQQRYYELTGWACPKAGGPALKALSDNQKQQDKAARLRIAQELGHGRLEITKTYLG